MDYIAEIRSELIYDPELGHLIRRYRRGRHPANVRVGHARKDGYRVVFILGHSELEHRVIWAYVYGAWPNGEIDHINGDPGDNRIENLRIVSHRDNILNSPRRKDFVNYGEI